MAEDSSVCSSDSMTPLRYISVGSSELTTKERLGVCCKPSFKLTRLKKKGAILVLVWSYLCTSVLYFYLETAEVYYGIEFLIQAITHGLTLSIAGWIADVRFGRYRVMYLSIWIMWAALMLATVSFVLARLMDSYASIHSYVNEVLWTVIAIGFGGFEANVIQFGIDQLHDASSNEIASFILWYVWNYSANGFAIFFVFGCLPKQYWIVGNLVLCIYMSIALSSMLMFNHWLVKEPVTQNPFKLVYNVIRYAIKHKHPECRSAFTFCEDEPPSRIDFGKSKYGGPFTTEQVEDVKTFLRVMLVICIGIVIFVVIFANWQLQYRIVRLLTVIPKSFYSSCYSKEGFIESFFFGSVLVLPFYEFIFYPLFRRCLEIVNSYWKFILGVVLLTLGIIALLVIETVARHNYFTNYNYNITIPCMGHGILGSSMDYRWMAVPFLLFSLSTTAIGIGAVEFIVSQVPYSMRGLVMGITYGMLSVCAAVGVGISIPFTEQSSIWGTGIISCGFWYALLLLVVGVLVGFMLTAMQICYKKRKREDVLPNEHIFAERYYDRDNLTT